jgi:hypothetical protein
MNESETVTVFHFETLDGGVEMARFAGYKATRERIAAIRGAKLLEGTGEKVPTTELDAQGTYRRIPTGWGEL